MRKPTGYWTKTLSRIRPRHWRPGKRQRNKPRSHQFEPLERREMLAGDLLRQVDDLTTSQIIVAPAAHNTGDFTLTHVDWTGKDAGGTLYNFREGLAPSADPIDMADNGSFQAGQHWSFTLSQDGVLMGIQFAQFSLLDADRAWLTVGDNDPIEVHGNRVDQGHWRPPGPIEFTAGDTLRLEAIALDAGAIQEALTAREDQRAEFLAERDELEQAADPGSAGADNRFLELTPEDRAERIADIDAAIIKLDALGAPEGTWRVEGLFVFGADENTHGGYIDLAHAEKANPKVFDELGREIPDQPSYVITSGSGRSLFDVATVADGQGGLRAEITPAVDAQIEEGASYHLDIEYYDGTEWTSRQLVTVNPVTEDFQDKLSAERIRRAQASISLLDDSVAEEKFAELERTERLAELDGLDNETALRRAAALARSLVNDPERFGSENRRLKLYSLLEDLISSATTVRSQVGVEDPLAAIGLVLSDVISTDALSEQRDLAQKASELAAALESGASRTWAGYHDLAKNPDAIPTVHHVQIGTTRFDLLQSGILRLGNKLSVDIGRPAMVVATELNDGRSPDSRTILTGQAAPRPNDKTPDLWDEFIDSFGDQLDPDALALIQSQRFATASAAPSAPASAGSTTSALPSLFSTADTHVSSTNPSTNYSTDVSLNVQNRTASGEDLESYLQFDLDQAGVAATIDSATVLLHVVGSSGTPSNEAVPVLDESWSASTIDWTTRPTNLDTALPAWTVDTSIATEVSVDVTDLVKSRLIQVGDMNGDGTRDSFDASAFTLALVDRTLFDATYPLVDADRVGDANQNGSLGDLLSFNNALTGITPWPETVSPPFALRIHAPNESTTDYAWYGSLEDGAVANRPSVEISTVVPDIVVAGFDSDGTNLRVQYDVNGSYVNDFNIGVYTSQDGVTPDQLLMTVPVTEDEHQGLRAGQEVVFQANFTDIQQDYQLLAIVDHDDQIVETDNDNNQALFAGGVFQAVDGIVHMQATTANFADTVALSENAGANEVTVTWNGTPYSFDTTILDVTGVHIRTHADNDTMPTATIAFTRPIWAFGGAGTDNLRGGTAGDFLEGGDGIDTVYGGGGNDTIHGDFSDDPDSTQGNGDYLHGDAGNDTLYGGYGADWIDGGTGDDELHGGTEKPTFGWTSPIPWQIDGSGGGGYFDGGYGDYLYGNHGDDTIHGDKGNDYGYGGFGADTIFGGEGDDYLFGDARAAASSTSDDDILHGDEGEDLLEGGLGNDEIHGGDGADDLYGDDGDDMLHGDAGADFLYGKSGNDTLHGNDGNDTLYGGDDDDMLHGDAGNDTVRGGKHDDTFIFAGTNLGSDRLHEPNSAQTPAVAGDDTLDFSGLASGIQLNLDWTSFSFTSTDLALTLLNGDEQFENIIGTAYNDTLTGNTLANKIHGGPGVDTLDGAAGDDILDGGPGTDVVNDTVGTNTVLPDIESPGDFDGNDLPETARWDYVSDGWQILDESQNVIQSGESWLMALDWTDVQVGDWNGDGRDDLAGLSTASGGWEVGISTGTSFLRHAWGSPSAPTWGETLIGDFNGDGRDDLVGWNAGTLQWQVLSYLETGAPDSIADWGSAGPNIDGQSNVVVIDANQDRRDDLVRTVGADWWVALSVVAGSAGASGGSSGDSGGLTGAFLPEQNWEAWFDGWMNTGSVDADGPIQEVLDIFESVYNRVELELYPGLMKGTEATDQTSAGNPWDQAALLVDRLEAAEYEADIATGQVQVDVEQLQDWLGVESSNAVLTLITGALDQFATWVVTDQVLQFKHAWVRVHLPTDNGLDWIDLDPSWKFKDRQEGIEIDLSGTNGTFDELDYLSLDEITDKRLPIEYYEDQVMQYVVANHPGKSLADVPKDGPIITKTFDQIPADLGEGVTIVSPSQVDVYDNLATITGNPALAAQLTHRVTVSLTRDKVSDSRALSLDPGSIGTTFPSSDFDTPGNLDIDPLTPWPSLNFYDAGGPNDNGNILEESGARRLAGTVHVRYPVGSFPGYLITPDTRLRITYKASSTVVGHRVVLGWDYQNDIYNGGSGEQVNFATIPPAASSDWQTVILGPTSAGGYLADRIVLGLRHSNHMGNSLLQPWLVGSDWIDISDISLYEARTGTATVVNTSGGKSIRQLGEHYLSLDAAAFNHQVTENSVLELEFKSSSVGALHAVGWDIDDTYVNDASQSSSRYQLAGTSSTYPTLTPIETLADGYQRFHVPIGDLMSSSTESDLLSRLIFDTDGGASTESLFRNLKVITDIGVDGEHWSQTLSVPEHSLSPISIDYVTSSNASTTANDDTYRSRLWLDGSIAQQGSTNEVLQVGDKANIKIEHFAPTAFYDAVRLAQVDKVISFSQQPGEIVAIGLEANQHSTESLTDLQENLISQLQIGTSKADYVNDIDELLSYTSAKYWYDLNRYNEQVERLTHSAGIQQWVGSGIASAKPDLLLDESSNYVIDHLSYAIAPVDMGVDLPNINHATYDLTTGLIDEEAFQLIGYNGSALEHTVVEEAINTGSVSTMKGLQNAYHRDRGLDANNNPITNDSVYVFDSIPNGGSRTIKYRGEWYTGSGQPTLDVTKTTSDVISMLANHAEGSGGSNPTATAVANLLSAPPSTMAGTIRILIPKGKSQVGNWIGSVYVVESDNIAQYKIAKEGGPTTNGGFSGNVTVDRDPLLPFGSFFNETFAGDPVNIANGNMFRDEVDFVIPNIGIPLAFARHYDSQGEEDIGLGVGWTHSYSDHLHFEDTDEDGDNDIAWLTGQGQRRVFTNNGSGYDVPSTFRGTFSQPGSNYVFRSKDGTTHTFNSTGKLTEIRDRNGNALLVTYISSTKIDSVRDEVDPARKIQFTYSGNQISSVEDTISGRTWTYDQYQTIGGEKHLGRVTSPSDSETAAVVTQYDYYTSGLLSGLMKKITEPDGGWHTYEYYPNGRAFRVTEGIVGDEGAPNGITSSHSFSYHMLRKLTTFTDERGQLTSYHHDNEGQLLRQTYPDRTHDDYTWQDSLMESATNALGQTEEYDYYANNLGNLEEVRARDGMVTRFTYEPNFSQVATITVNPGTGQQVTQFVHDSNGNVIRQVDPLGNETTMTYDARGQLIARAEPNRDTVAPANLITHYTFNNGLLNDMAIADGATDGISASGMSFHPGVDGFGEALRLTGAQNNSMLLETDVPIGTDWTISTWFTTPLTNNGGNWYTLILGDNADRHIKVKYDGNNLKLASWEQSTATLHETDTGYSLSALTDGWHHLTAVGTPDGGDGETTFYIDGIAVGVSPYRSTSPIERIGALSGGTQQFTDNLDDIRVYNKALNATEVAKLYGLAGDFTTTFDYNGAGQFVSAKGSAVQNGNVAETVSTYDTAGNLKSTTDPTGIIVNYDYDLLGRRLKQTLPDPGGAGSTGPIVTSFTYTPRGRLETTTDALNHPTTNVYDLKGRLVEVQYVDGTKTTFTYDAAGNQVSATDELGRTTKFVYDGRNRLIQTRHADGTLERTYYNALGNVVQTTNALDHSAQVTYDEVGRILKTRNRVTLVDDKFTRSELGDTWSQEAGQWSITNGRASSDNSGSNLHAIHQHNLTTPNYVVEAVVRSDDFASAYPRLVARWQDDDNFTILSLTKHSSTGQLQIYLETWKDGSATNQSNPSSNPDWQLGALTNLDYQIGLIVEGDVLTPTFNGKRLSSATHTHLDSPGQAGIWVTGTDETAVSFDEFRLVELHDTRSRYDNFGNLTSVTDARGNATLLEFDKLGRVVESRSPKDGYFDTGDNFTGTTEYLAISTTDYDANGNVIAQTNYEVTGLAAGSVPTDPRTLATSRHRKFETRYDVLSRPVEQIDPLAQSDFTTYDLASRVLTQTNNEGLVTGFEYDNIGRQTETTIFAGLHAVPDAAWQNQSNPADVNGDGELSPVDPLIIINEINTPQHTNPDGSFINPAPAPGVSFYDVDGDDLLSPLDALLVINRLNEVLDVKRTTTYDAVGNVIATTDPLGYKTDFEYDIRGRLFRTTDAENNVTQNVYDVAGQLRSTTDALLQSTKFNYDQRGRLVGQLLPDPDGTASRKAPVTLFTYDAAGNRIAETAVDVDGDLGGDQSTFFEYDERGRLVRTFRPGPVFFSTKQVAPYDIAEDEVGNSTPNRPSIFDVEDGGRTLKLSGNAWKKIDLGAVYEITPDTVIEFDFKSTVQGEVHGIGFDDDDTRGVPSKKILKLHGSEPASIWLESNEGVDAYTGGGNWQHYKIRLGDVVGYQFGAARYLTFVNDDDNRPYPTHTNSNSFFRDVTIHGLTGAATISAFDATNNLTSTVDPLGRTTTFTYDALGRLLTETLPDPDGPAGTGGPGGSDLSAPSTTNTYDSLGNLIQTADQNNRLTTYEYDVLNRLEREKLAAGTSDETEYFYTYDAVGNLETVQNLTDPRNIVTKYVYDDLGRRTSEILDFGGTDPGTADTTTEFKYDAAGNLVKQTDAAGKATTFAYDKLGRQIKQTLPDPDTLGSLKAPVTEWAYDAVGNLLTETVVDVDGRLGGDLVSSFAYDALGRQTLATQPNGDHVDSTYDALGRLRTLTDGELNTTIYAYNTYGLVESETNELGKTRSFTYDPAGNRTAQTDRRGRTIHFTYDDLNRLTTEDWIDPANGTTVLHTITSVYGNLGQLNELANNEVTFSYTYDNLDRLTYFSRDDISPHGANPIGAMLLYGYDDAGNLTSRTQIIDTTFDPSALNWQTTSQAYDRLNRLERIEQYGSETQSKRVDFTYDAVGNFRTVNRYADTTGTNLVVASTYDYDDAHRLTGMSHDNGELLTVPFADYDYTIDAAGRITNQTSADGSNHFTYDAAGQLTGATLTGESYTYDDAGNRTGGGHVVQSDNRLTDDGTFIYTYDDEGNRLSRTRKSSAPADDHTLEYTWDHRNRLTEVRWKNNSGTVTRIVDYTYGPDDLLLTRSVNENGTGPVESAERYMYDGDRLALVFDYLALGAAANSRDAIKNRYMYGPAVDMILADEQYDPLAAAAPGEVLWPLADHQGTVRDVAEYVFSLTNYTTVVNHIEYDSFGNITDQDDPSVDHRFGFTGRDWDADAQAYYYRARWYDPAVGQFISEDPLGFAAGDANLKRYVGNSPVTFVDPSGLTVENPQRSVINGIVNTIGGSLTTFAGSAISQSTTGQLLAGAGLGAASIASFAELPILSGSSFTTVYDFLSFRSNNLERREQERQQAIDARVLRKAQALGFHGRRAQKLANPNNYPISAFDYPLAVEDGGVIDVVMRRLEDEVLLNVTGLTRDEAVLPLIKSTVSAFGRDPAARSDEWYLSQPGRWPFDAAVGAASNPLTYAGAVTSIAPRLRPLGLFDDGPGLGSTRTFFQVTDNGIDLSTVAPNSALNVLDNQFTPNFATGNKVTAFEFYTEQAGFSSQRALQHIDGIDFTRPVTPVTIPYGSTAQQFVGPRGTGNYFAPTRSTPLQSGIPDVGQFPTLFQSFGDVPALQSYTRPDYIFPPGGVVPGSGAGGGLQYFVPDNSLLVPITR